ncbi:MAG: amidohydrolase [Bacteroidetes bacterium]|nr:amidohydrolase [Bacteroidota bacterium]
MQNLKILALQANLSWENPKKNRLEFEKRIELEFDSHNLIILPETFTTGFPVDPQQFSETIKGPTVRWMRNISAKYNAVITGTVLIQTKNNYTNTLIWMQPDGNYQTYRKRHVFSMGGEHERITAGNEKLIVELMGWKICPMICYDLRFPVWSKNTYNENNTFEYDLAIYVANWPAVRSYPWKTLLRARAIENQAYIIGVNRVGTDGQGNRYSGDSAVINPKGMLLKQGGPDKDEALSATLSLDDLINFRKQFNVGADWDSFTIE